MFLFADYGLGSALLTTLSIFFFVIWIWIMIQILTDLFRDHDLSGWGKAAWVLLLVFIPFLTALVYLVARGDGMRDRALKAQSEAQKHFNDYIRETAGAPGASPVDELHKLADLKDRGALSAEEYETAKAKYLA